MCLTPGDYRPSVSPASRDGRLRMPPAARLTSSISTLGDCPMPEAEVALAAVRAQQGFAERLDRAHQPTWRTLEEIVRAGHVLSHMGEVVRALGWHPDERALRARTFIAACRRDPELRHLAAAQAIEIDDWEEWLDDNAPRIRS